MKKPLMFLARFGLATAIGAAGFPVLTALNPQALTQSDWRSRVIFMLGMLTIMIVQYAVFRHTTIAERVAASILGFLLFIIALIIGTTDNFDLPMILDPILTAVVYSFFSIGAGIAAIELLSTQSKPKGSICPKCGNHIRTSDLFCRSCGEKLSGK